MLVVAGLAGLVACTSPAATPPPTTTTPSGAISAPTATPGPGAACPLGPKAVPTCGALWGVSTQPATLAGVEAIEAKVGREFDFVYRYHDVVGQIPDDEERAVVARGSLLHIAIAARKYRGNESLTYKQIAAGEFDATLLKQAQGVASLKAPVFVTFEQEANQKDKVGPRGTPAEFIAAWRHLHQLYAQAGASNAVWVWVMTGNQANLERAGELWPGNQYVDWISWNNYNQSGCRTREIDVARYQSFEEGLRDFYEWLKSTGLVKGIDANKPIMISEAGSARYADNPAKSAQWYADIPAALAKYPQVKAVGLWASGGGGSEGGTCDYRFQLDPVITQGVASAGKAIAEASRPAS